MGFFDIDRMMRTILGLDVMILLSLVASGFSGLSFLSLFRRAADVERGRCLALASVCMSLAALAWVTRDLRRSPPASRLAWAVALSTITDRVGSGLLVEVGQARASRAEDRPVRDKGDHFRWAQAMT